MGQQAGRVFSYEQAEKVLTALWECVRVHVRVFPSPPWLPGHHSVGCFSRCWHTHTHTLKPSKANSLTGISSFFVAVLKPWMYYSHHWRSVCTDYSLYTVFLVIDLEPMSTGLVTLPARIMICIMILKKNETVQWNKTVKKMKINYRLCYISTGNYVIVLFNDPLGTFIPNWQEQALNCFGCSL